MDQVLFGGLDVLGAEVCPQQQRLGHKQMGRQVTGPVQRGDHAEDLGSLFIPAYAGLGQGETKKPFVTRLSAQSQQPLGSDTSGLEVLFHQRAVGQVGVAVGDFLGPPVHHAEGEAHPGARH